MRAKVSIWVNRRECCEKVDWVLVGGLRTRQQSMYA
jgi:hypothetical protein